MLLAVPDNLCGSKILPLTTLDASDWMVIVGTGGNREDTIMEPQSSKVHQERSILASSVRLRLMLNLIFLVVRG